ncbi:MAG: GHKL domain-containing protein [Oligoflexia bacterium]|nr:GHKL domain-containing protein [Oligoflexia bacterium]
MQASILIVGHPRPESVEFGADFSDSYESAENILKEKTYSVLAIKDQIENKSCIELLKKIHENNQDTQTILVTQENNATDLQKFINEAHVFKILNGFETQSFQLSVREALEEFELIKQNQTFLNLRTEQNKKLQTLTQTLEEKVSAREEFLIRSREILLNTTKKLSALSRALLAIQKSSNKGQVEKSINDALKAALDLSWTQILFKGQSFIEGQVFFKQDNVEILSAPLLKNKVLLGHIYFARERVHPFTQEDVDFLLQVSDAVSLTIDRLITMEQLEGLKQEWDATFDAITSPFSMITENYKIIRANKAYAENAQTTPDKIIGQKCHEILFNQPKPCQECNLGHAFNINSLQVHTQELKLANNQTAYVCFYQDTSEQSKMQRQILESSKMAELGTIGSSIAHEINNPLGGILAFIQIIKNELSKEDKRHQDIVDMEQAALRCKSIVENLLSFTRVSQNADFKPQRLGDILRSVLNIIELQTRAIGIKIEKEISAPDVKIKGDFNQLVQVFVNVLQNSCEALAERMSKGKRTPAPFIEIKSVIKNNKLEIHITDNGPGIAASSLPKVFTPFFTTKDKTKNTGLGLSVSYQIVKEHFGEMEISSTEGKSTTVVIQFPTV